MIWKPKQLGRQKIEERELEADKKNCRRFGPCGVGQKALYLNSFYFDRRYYVALDSVSRVFKRVAMSKGGFREKECLPRFHIWSCSMTAERKSSVFSKEKSR